MNIFEMLEAVKELREGDYAECGVYQGFMAEKIAAGMNGIGTLWLFDSFVGHAEPSEFDDPIKHPKGRYADTSPDEIKMKCPKAVIVKGFIPETLCLVNSGKFRFVHIDLDHYLPTKAACEFFKPRMVAGGIIRFDDYSHGETPGATKAIDEVFGRDNILSEDYRWHNSC